MADSSRLLVQSAYSPSPAYQFSPLRSEDSTRLLRVHSGNRDERLSCTLSEAEISSHQRPEYFAISYACGNPDLTNFVHVDGAPFPVTANCFEVLLNLREPNKDLVIWIDAVCMNQQDDIEKGQQIQRMGVLYRQAEEVIVWLGDSSPGMHQACKLLHRLQECLQDRTLSTSSSLDEALSKTHTTRQSQLWRDLSNLCSSDWFFRLWVIQEVVLARRISFRSGSNAMSWAVMDLAARLLLRHTSMMEFGGSAFLKFINAKTNFEKASQCGQVMPLSSLLNWSQHSLTSDERDRVYGLVGILKSGDETELPTFEVNYALPLEQMYVYATRWCIQNEQSLDVLSLVSRKVITGRQLSLPSWAFDLASGIEHSALAFREDYSACNAASFVNFQSRSFERLGRVLVLSGFLLDEVSDVSSSVCDTDGQLLGTDFKFLVEFCIEVASMYQASPTASHVEFWRTLLADHLEDGHDRMMQETTTENVLQGQTLFETHFLRHPNRFTLCGTYELLLALGEMHKLSAEQKNIIRAFLLSLKLAVHHRRFAFTRSQDLALVLPEARPGDIVCVLAGGKVLFIIRPEPDQGPEYYRFIGDAYVHGMMKNKWSPVGKEMQTIKLV